MVTVMMAGAELFDVPSETTIDARVDGEQQQASCRLGHGLALTSSRATGSLGHWLC